MRILCYYLAGFVLLSPVFFLLNSGGTISTIIGVGIVLLFAALSRTNKGRKFASKIEASFRIIEREIIRFISKH